MDLEFTATEVYVWRRTHPNAAVHNTCFALVRWTAASADRPAIVWVGYQDLARLATAVDKSMGACLWDTLQRRANIIIAKASGAHIDVSVWTSDSASTIADYPLVLDLKDYDSWPGGGEPVSTHTIRTPDSFDHTIGALNIKEDAGKLVLHFDRIDSPSHDYEPIVVSFDPQTGQWRDVPAEK